MDSSILAIATLLTGCATHTAGGNSRDVGAADAGVPWSCDAPLGETDRVALVVANSGYAHGAYLAGPRRDGERVAAAFEAVGFTVRRCADLSVAELDSAVATFRRDVPPRARFVASYYAGHGFEIEGTNYLVGVDFEPESERSARYEAYELPQMIDELAPGAEDAWVALLLVDACRNDPWTRSWSKSGTSRGFHEINPDGLPDEVYVGFSTGVGQRAADDGAFANSFAVRLLAAQDFDVVMRHVRRDVRLETHGQTPITVHSLTGLVVLGETAPVIESSLPPRDEPPPAWDPANPLAYPMISVAAGRHQLAGGASVDLPYDYQIGYYEVTQALWREAMGAPSPAWPTFDGQPLIGEAMPVQNVTWPEAARFCNALSLRVGLQPAYAIVGEDVRWDPAADGYRLPTHAEWKLAWLAAGGVVETDSAYTSGFDVSERSRPKSTPVRAVDEGVRDGWGIVHMGGNVEEWLYDALDTPYMAKDVWDWEPLTSQGPLRAVGGGHVALSPSDEQGAAWDVATALRGVRLARGAVR